MNPRELRRLLPLVLSGLLSATAAAEEAAKPTTYEDVKSVFRKRCTTCHNEGQARGGLDLTTFDGVKAGSSSGPVVFARKPDESLIYTLPAHLEDPKMPPGAPKIPQRELDLIRSWIMTGLTDQDTPAKPAVARVMAPAKTTPAAGMAQTAANSGLEPVRAWPRPAPLTALAASPKTPLIAVAGRNQIVLFTDPGQPPIGALPFPEGNIFVLKFVRGGDVLLAGGGVGAEAGKVVGFDVATRKRLFTVGDEPDAVLAADLSPDGSLVALGGPGKVVKLYRTSDGELVTTLKKHTDWILSVAFSPDGLLLASSDRFGGMQVWEAKTGKAFETLRGHQGPVTAVWWPRSSDELATAGDDGTVRLWNMHQGAQVSLAQAGVGPVLAVAADARGRVLVGGRQKRLAILDHSLSPTSTIDVADEIVELAVMNSGKTVIVSEASGAAVAINLEKPESRTPLLIPIAKPAQSSVADAPLRRSQMPSLKAETSAAAPVSVTAPAAAKSTSNMSQRDRLRTAREDADLAEAAVKATEAALTSQRAIADRLRQEVRRLESATGNP